MNGKSTWLSHRYWLASCFTNCLRPGSFDSGVNHPGKSPIAPARASRAWPFLVFWALAAAVSAPVRLPAGSVMWTRVTDGSISFWNANAASRAVFQVATPPDSTPHMGSAALNLAGNRWMRPAVMMPPSEWPHATVRDGLPYLAANAFSVLIWSGSACWIAHPVVAYEDPAR